MTSNYVKPIRWDKDDKSKFKELVCDSISEMDLPHGLITRAGVVKFLKGKDVIRVFPGLDIGNQAQKLYTRLYTRVSSALWRLTSEGVLRLVEPSQFLCGFQGEYGYVLTMNDDEGARIYTEVEKLHLEHRKAVHAELDINRKYMDQGIHLKSILEKNKKLEAEVAALTRQNDAIKSEISPRKKVLSVAEKESLLSTITKLLDF